jgi:hypothetical protein
MRPIPRLRLILTAIVLSITSGCDNREAEIAREAADRQARQNETMAALQQDVTAGTRTLAENDAKARQQSLEVHRDLQSERAKLGDQWQDLEQQRQAIAASRRTDSFLSALVTGSGGLLAALLALGFAWLTLFGLHRSGECPELAGELLAQLIEEDWQLADMPLPNPLLTQPTHADRLPSPPADPHSPSDLKEPQ